MKRRHSEGIVLKVVPGQAVEVSDPDVQIFPPPVTEEETLMAVKFIPTDVQQPSHLRPQRTTSQNIIPQQLSQPQSFSAVTPSQAAALIKASRLPQNPEAQNVSGQVNSQTSPSQDVSGQVNSQASPSQDVEAQKVSGQYSPPLLEMPGSAHSCHRTLDFGKDSGTPTQDEGPVKFMAPSILTPANTTSRPIQMPRYKQHNPNVITQMLNRLSILERRAATSQQLQQAANSLRTRVITERKNGVCEVRQDLKAITTAMVSNNSTLSQCLGQFQRQLDGLSLQLVDVAEQVRKLKDDPNVSPDPRTLPTALVMISYAELHGHALGSQCDICARALAALSQLP